MISDANVGLAITSVTTIIVAYIAFQQVKLNKKVDNYHKEVNGKVTKLLETKDAESEAKQTVARLEGEKAGAKGNQDKTDAKKQDKK